MKFAKKPFAFFDKYIEALDLAIKGLEFINENFPESFTVKGVMKNEILETF